MWKYGIFIDGMLMEKFDTPEEAYEEALIAYEASGLFHEVRLTHQQARTIND